MRGGGGRDRNAAAAASEGADLYSFTCPHPRLISVVNFVGFCCWFFVWGALCVCVCVCVRACVCAHVCVCVSE